MMFRAAALVLAAGAVCSAGLVDLTARGAEGTIGDAIFKQVDFDTSGTGRFNTFLSIKNNSVEEGYNTGHTNKDLNTQSARALLLSEVPTVTIGGIEYREFCLDINETGNHPKLSIDKLRFYVAHAGNLRGLGNLGAAVYDMDANEDSSVELDYSLNAGSGHGDMAVLVRSSLFGADENRYVYLYSNMGARLQSDDGFEEWGIGAAGPIVPEPATLVILGMGGLALLRRNA